MPNGTTLLMDGGMGPLVMDGGMGPLVMDGGMGRELERIGAPFRQPEWSAAALLEDPRAVVEAHTNFIEAGAELIIANTYAVVPFHLGAERFAERGSELAGLAARLAREAADSAQNEVLVAGSIPPLFGSYQPALFDAEVAPAMLDLLIEAQAPYVDLWIAETLGSTAEALAVAEAFSRNTVDGQRWFAYSLHDDLVDGVPVLWSGESVEDAVRTAVRCGAHAVLLNCAPPDSIDIALPIVAAVVAELDPSVRIGAYANAFEPREDGYSANSVILGRRDELTAPVYADIARGWIAAGATIVGGCCGIHPEQIAAVRESTAAGRC